MEVSLLIRCGAALSDIMQFARRTSSPFVFEKIRGVDPRGGAGDYVVELDQQLANVVLRRWGSLVNALPA